VTDALRTAGDYELFIYTIAERFPSIERSTLRFIRRGAALARVVGELYFAGDVRLTVLQRVVYDRLPALIDAYGYEAWRGDEKLYWYDSQPHPASQRCKVAILITSTSRRTSGTRASRHRACASTGPTCRP